MPTRPSHALAFLFGFAAGLWLLLPLLAPAASSEGAPQNGLRTLEAELSESVNGFRREHHLIPLERRADLDEVARAHSEDMAQRRFFAHENPEGENWVHRMQRGGIEGFAMAGENVGLTSRGRPNHEILNGWIHSPEHRTNLMARPFNATGVGIARGADGTLYYTQLYVNFPR